MAEQNRETAQENKDENPFAGFKSEVFDRGEPVDVEERPAGASEEQAPPPPKKESQPGDVQEGVSDEQHPEVTKDGEQQPPPPPKKPNVQERINEITRARREAERERDAERQRREALEAKLREIEAKQAPPKVEVPKKEAANAEEDPDAPKPEDYDYGEIDPRYIKALAVHEADKRFKELRAADDKKAAERVAEQEREQALAKFEEMLDKGSKKYEDYYEKVVVGSETGLWPLSAELGSLLLESEVGEEIAYHLASNPEEAFAVYNATPLEQARYFGSMEVKFSAERAAASGNGVGKPTPKIPKAPPPVEAARGAGGQFQATADTDDFASFEQRANSGS